MELRSILIEYKVATDNLIEAIKHDEDGQQYIEEREVLIDTLKKNEFNNKELKAIYEELGLVELEKEAFKTLNNEKLKVKEEITNMKRKKEANRSYGNQLSNINFFNTKV